MLSALRQAAPRIASQDEVAKLVGELLGSHPSIVRVREAVEEHERDSARPPDSEDPMSSLPPTQRTGLLRASTLNFTGNAEGRDLMHAGNVDVFVTDGSCMVSTACQNPSLTYMALTARAAGLYVGRVGVNPGRMDWGSSVEGAIGFFSYLLLLPAFVALAHIPLSGVRTPVDLWPLRSPAELPPETLRAAVYYAGMTADPALGRLKDDPAQEEWVRTAARCRPPR